MSIDEFETIRLIDFEGLTQKQCAEQMDVARTTVQAIYRSARKKLAQGIVQGISMQIEGGDVHVCEHRNDACDNGCCKMREKAERKGGSNRE